MIAHKIAFTFYAKILRSLIGLVSLYLVSQYLGPEIQGSFAMYGSLAMIMNFVAEFALQIPHVRAVHSGRDIGTCVGTLFKLRSCFSILSVLLSVALAFAVGFGEQSNYFEREGDIIIFSLWLGGQFLWNLTSFIPDTFTAQKKMVKSQAIEITQIGINLLLNIVAVFWFPTALALAWAYFLSNVLSSLLALFYLKDLKFGKADKELAKEYMKLAWPLLVPAAAGFIVLNLDRICIGLWVNEASVGYYHGADRINRIFMMISGAALPLLVPSFAEYFHRKDFADISRLLNRAQHYLSLLVLPFLLAAGLCGEGMVLLILGPQYEASIPVLWYLLGVTYCYGYSRPLIAVLAGGAKTRLLAIGSVVGMILNVALNMLFIPSALWGIPMLGFGASGAALSSVVAAFLNLFFHLFLLKLASKEIQISLKPFLQLLCAGLAIGSAVLFRAWVPLNPIPGSLLQTFIGMAVFGVSALLLKQIGREDFDYILRNVGFKTMKSYVAEELKDNKGR